MMTTDVSTNMTPQQQFHENIKERLRKDIGDLIPDAALGEMVNAAIKEMFFTKRKERQQYGADKTHPSWFEDEVMSLMKAKIGAELARYLTENDSALRELVLEQIKENMPKLLTEAIISGFTNTGVQMGYVVGQHMAEGIRAGMSGFR